MTTKIEGVNYGETSEAYHYGEAVLGQDQEGKRRNGARNGEMRKDPVGGSACAIFSSQIGPRLALAPPDENGGGAAGGAGAGGDGGSGAAGGGDGAGGNGGAGGAAGDGKEPSALAKGVADASKPAEDPAPTGKVEGADKVKPEGEAKTEEAKPGEEKKEGEGELAADAPVKDVDGNALPEKYEIKMPDGMEMDAKLMEVAEPLFREHKMSPAQAQAMTDLYTKVQGDAIKAHNAMTAQWAEDAKKDPEIGGANYEENIAHASKAFKMFGDERALQIFDTYGLGNNPSILRTFARIGKAMGEGATILPGSGTGRVSDAQALYPNMTK